MKGKHANAAEKRRYVEGLEARATEAERQVEKLTAELAQLREVTGQELGAQRERITELIRQRDESAHPKLTEAAETIARLTAEREMALGQVTGLQQYGDDLFRRMRSLLRDAGVSDAEIRTTGQDALDQRGQLPGADISVAAGVLASIRRGEAQPRPKAANRKAWKAAIDAAEEAMRREA